MSWFALVGRVSDQGPSLRGLRETMKITTLRRSRAARIRPLNVRRVAGAGKPGPRPGSQANFRVEVRSRPPLAHRSGRLGDQRPVLGRLRVVAAVDQWSSHKSSNPGMKPASPQGREVDALRRWRAHTASRWSPGRSSKVDGVLILRRRAGEGRRTPGNPVSYASCTAGPSASSSPSSSRILVESREMSPARREGPSERILKMHFAWHLAPLAAPFLRPSHVNASGRARRSSPPRTL